eukprot:gnl/MRDRNA2_/MRDRNA2_284987_c0_seq1.p1 gnl/MRDRNA2_/MRDRNA2_284987_c0~~gnl/MRDRNA2_/MRDRNA2_284987_c0_seq1.p1  ORF type:complete len:324 (+),score=41.52 gnl/MRDRNA2_/MRDRNA2_284987_c0_seq1:66-974(+)
MIAVILPGFLLVLILHLGYCDAWETSSGVCWMYYKHPIVFVNVLFGINVDVGFWFVYQIQGSTWLIDPHWTILPACIAVLYFTHPLAVVSLRSVGTLVLTVSWAVRLTYNYFRREGWQFGVQEDWRYADMRRRFGKHWWYISFFAVNLAQHPMLVGMTLPLCAAMIGSPVALGSVDFLGFLCCITGIVVAYYADIQLHEYMGRQDKDKPMVLDTGLWHYSRHPNHFGEQLWWVGLAWIGFAAAEGSWWPFLGVLYNHPIDTFVTLNLIEERMLRKEERRKLYQEYQARTSQLVPWPPRSKKA